MRGDSTLHDHPHLSVSVQGQFGIDYLSFGLSPPTAELPQGHVGIKLTHSALNYRDLMMIEGLYNPRQVLPLIPCSDGIGRVTQSHPESQWQLEQRVMPIFSQSWLDGEPNRLLTKHTLGGPLNGTLRRSASFSSEGLVPVPDYLNDAEASTLGCAALTAWSALIELGHLRTGDHVLCIGTGGVSLFAAQIAAMSGARVTLISRHEAKLDWVMNHPNLSSFKHLIVPFHTPEGTRWGREIKKNFGEFDHIVEVGGAGTLQESLQAVRAGGTISLIGVLAGGGASLNLTPVLMRQIKIQGVIVGHKAGMMRMLKAFECHKLRPILDEKIFKLANADQAFLYMKSAQHIGKIVIDHN